MSIEENDDGGQAVTNKSLEKLLEDLVIIHKALLSANEKMESLQQVPGVGSLIATILLVNILTAGKEIEEAFGFINSIAGTECGIADLIKYMVNKIKEPVEIIDMKKLLDNLSQ